MDYKLKNVITQLSKMKKVIIAYSGGVDSSLLIKIAYNLLKDDAIAVTIASPMHPEWERRQAERIAKEIGIQHILISIKENELKEIFQNNKDRCYHCKRLIYSKIQEIADEKNIQYVLDGSNADDLYDYRPGFKALDELQIISPLKKAGLTKTEIRRLSKEMDLETYTMPSFACLASRFPYTVDITTKRLKQVEHCEKILMSLGIRQCRVRYHQDIARIEVEKKDFNTILDNVEMIITDFKKNGFHYVTLDLQGYRTGSLNEVLYK